MRKSLIRPDRTGEIIDARYKLVGLLIDEPFGQRYQAEQVNTGAKGLLWLVPKKHCSEIRFRRESHKLSQFAHPHAAPLVDFGVWKTDWFLVHAAREGQTLLAFLEQSGPLSDEQVVRFLGPVAASLAEAHTRALAHGRLTLEHVFIRDLPDAEAFVQVDEIGLAGFFGHDEAVKADLRALGRLGASLLGGEPLREVPSGHPSSLARLFDKLLDDFRPPPALKVLDKLKTQPGAPKTGPVDFAVADAMGDTLAPHEAKATIAEPPAQRDTLWDPSISVDIAAQDFEDFERLGLSWRVGVSWPLWFGGAALLIIGAVVWTLSQPSTPTPKAPDAIVKPAPASGIKIVAPPDAAPVKDAESAKDATPVEDAEVVEDAAPVKAKKATDKRLGKKRGKQSRRRSQKRPHKPAKQPPPSKGEAPDRSYERL